jgi:hypothetical protein
MSVATVQEPARETPVLTETDVLVVGGGSAGVAAAVAAARSGARVVLTERYGSLGGLATGGLIVLLLTLDDGRGRQVISGLCQEMTERMDRAKGAFFPPAEHWGSDDPALVDHYYRWGLVWGGSGRERRVRYSVAYDPDVMRQVLNEICLESGVDLIFHMWGADALIEDGRLKGVAFQSKAGRQAILAKVVIDTTGDGDIFTSAGCPFELEKIHPWLWFRMGGVENREEAIDAGGWFFRTPAEGQVLLPWGSMARIDRKIDATDPRDLSYAEIECRRLVMEEFEKLRGSVPGMEEAHICNIASQLGITESRRLVGRYVLTRDEMNRDFDDAICVTGHWTKYGVMYAVPYRCLLAQEVPNLLAAGRNISVDHRTHNATKEIPPCMATGQAAGIAAAMALEHGGDAGAVDVALLRVHLAQAGALLDYPFESTG